MNIFVARRLPMDALQGLPSAAKVDMYEAEDVAIPRKVLLNRVRNADAILSLLTENIDAEVMEAAGSNLRIIANLAVGYDNIDIHAAEKRGIYVTNTPDVLTETTADLIFGLLLATARRIPEGERFLRNGSWQTWSPMLMTGQDVFGQTIGIIGMGRIGQAVAKRALGFGMRIVYTSRTRKPQVEQALSCTHMPLDALCRTADFIVPLTPASDTTKHLIGSHELNLMKNNAILINASRGSVVDEDALFDALTVGRLWAAGLDVFAEEPVPLSNRLLTLPNVVALPHIGSASIQTRTRMAKMAVANIAAALTGQTPPNVVLA